MKDTITITLTHDELNLILFPERIITEAKAQFSRLHKRSIGNLGDVLRHVESGTNYVMCGFDVTDQVALISMATGLPFNGYYPMSVYNIWKLSAAEWVALTNGEVFHKVISPD